MGSTLKKILLLWPILVIVYFIGSTVVDQTSIDKKLIEADGLVWKYGDNHISVNVTRTSQGELNSYEITLIDNDSLVLFKDIFVIDTDMYGGGFVKAVQTDNDSDSELIVWGGHERDQSYALDISEGKITKTEFSKLPKEVHQLTKQWHQAYVKYRASSILLGIIVIGYYSIVMIVLLLIKLVRRRKARKV